ncbi:MAG: MerR family transcriptional regulator [Deltaproteobacteria bacterium]|jgi:DNA-binding transcriptional MerR regulator|nr:MerR family transcriptional regulator [Deltaproteobacteria bacterium]
MNISEVSRRLGLTADTLRYYEKEGLIPPVPRTRGGARDYGEKEFGWIEFIKCMRGAGIEVEALAEYVRLYQAGDSTVQARKQILIDQRVKIAARLAEIQATLDRLDMKIEHYESHIVRHEERFASVHPVRSQEDAAPQRSAGR